MTGNFHSKNPRRASRRERADEFDLGGVTPKSWHCIDCGINTFPGCPSRVELERRYRAAVAIGKLTGRTPPLANLEYDDRCEVYTVRDSVWKAAGIEPMGGCLCIGCLEKRIGRKLKPKDFPDHTFNDMPCTTRLFARRDVDPPRVVYVNPKGSAYVKEVFAEHFSDVRRAVSVEELLSEQAGERVTACPPELADFAAVSIDEDGELQAY